MVFDGAAIVRAFPRENTSTFGEYSYIFISWTERQLQSCKVFGGVCVRRKVSRNAKLPIYFAGFLQDDTNKGELFALLTEDVVKHEYPLNKQVFVTSGPTVKSNHADISMEESDHEEADSRICLKEGATTILVRTVDSDVVVILVGIFHYLVQHYPGMQLCVGFGTGNTSGITT